MASIRFYICFVLLESSLHTLVVKRGTQDVINAYGKKCWKVDAQWNNKTTCKCYKFVSTFASKESGDPTCVSAKKLKCNVLPEIKLISTKKSVEKFEATVDENCDIDEIRIWNVPTESTNEKGSWVDVTNVASQYFHLNKESNKLKMLSNFPVKLWKGHLIKIIFNCDDACVLIKVKGEISYPFDRRILVVTTPKPTISTTNPNKIGEKSSIPNSVYIIVGIVIAIVIILILILYIFRHKLPCFKRFTQKEKKLEESSIYSVPTHTDSAGVTTTQTGDEVYYSAIDPLHTDSTYSQLLTPANVINQTYESPNDTEGTIKRTGDEVYYSTIDPLHNSEMNPRVLSINQSSVTNPVYMDASPNIIKLVDEVDTSGSGPPCDELEVNSDDVDNSGSGPRYYELEVNPDEENKDFEKSKAVYENVDIK